MLLFAALSGAVQAAPAPAKGPVIVLRGAQCRTACAETRYQCRATDEADVCDSAWGQCVVNCPEMSSPSL